MRHGVTRVGSAYGNAEMIVCLDGRQCVTPCSRSIERKISVGRHGHNSVSHTSRTRGRHCALRARRGGASGRGWPGEGSSAPHSKHRPLRRRSRESSSAHGPEVTLGLQKRLQARSTAPSGWACLCTSTQSCNLPRHTPRSCLDLEPRSSTARSGRRPRRGRRRGQLAERLAQEPLGRREALVRVVGEEKVVMGREGRLSGDARALKVIEPRSVLL